MDAEMCIHFRYTRKQSGGLFLATSTECCAEVPEVQWGKNKTPTKWVFVFLSLAELRCTTSSLESVLLFLYQQISQYCRRL